MTEPRKGACLCGAVRFEVDLQEQHFHACHCDICRRWGGPALAVSCTAMRVDDSAPVGIYASSDYGERLFCGACGTHLFWRMKDESLIGVFIGTLEKADDLVLTTEFFIDRKPDHYSFAGERHKMTAAEVFAAMASDKG